MRLPASSSRSWSARPQSQESAIGMVGHASNKLLVGRSLSRGHGGGARGAINHEADRAAQREGNQQHEIDRVVVTGGEAVRVMIDFGAVFGFRDRVFAQRAGRGQRAQ